MEISNEDQFELSEDISAEPALSFLEVSDNFHMQENVEEKEMPESEKENEIQESVYKPRHLDTETLIKGEIKQVILTEVSEATSTKTLHDMTYEIEEQINSLKEKTNRLAYKNKNLDSEVETDNNRLKQTEAILLQTNEMIDLLKHNVEQLEKRFKESHVHEILEKSRKLHGDLEQLKSSYETKYDSENAKIEKILAEYNENNKILKFEIKNQNENVEILRKKHNDLKKLSSSYEEDIVKLSTKKQVLEEKLAEINNRHKFNSTCQENEFNNQDDLLHKFYMKKQNLDEKFSSKEKQILELKLQLENHAQEVNSISNKVCDLNNETLQKEILYEELLKQLELIKQNNEITIQKVKQNKEEVVSQLNKLETNIISFSQNTTQQYENLNKLKSDYVIKCEEKFVLTNKILNHQNEVHNLEVILTKKQLENVTKRTKLNDLQKQYEDHQKSARCTEDEKFKEQNKLSKDLTDLTAKYELLKAEKDKYFREIQKKKEYIQATSEYLKEKSENLKKEFNEIDNVCKSLNEENISLKSIIEKEQNSFNEMKRKLDALKEKTEETLLKSHLKSHVKENFTKKVHFNEVPSYKSVTESSENSSQHPTEIGTQLERSFHEWLEDRE